MRTALLFVVLAGCRPPGTHREVVHSDIVGRDFVIEAFVPAAASDRPLPLAVLLDGDPYFGWCVDDYAARLAAGDVEPVVIVGISYPGKNYRATDFSAAASDMLVEGGGSGQYRAFLEQELLPHLQQTLPISSEQRHRAILGHSLGGLLVIQLLLEGPAVFGVYGAYSPSLFLNDNLALGWEQQYADHHSDLDARVSMTFGAWEALVISGSNELFAQQLKSRRYPSLTFQLQPTPGAGHLENGMESMSQGLRSFVAKERR